MRLNSHVRRTVCAVICVCSGLLIRAADDAIPADIQPALQADFSSDGLLTWWLISPPVEPTADMRVPSNARDGEPVFPETPAMTAKWMPSIAGTFYNDLRSFIGSQKGMLYAATRVLSSTGGRRIFYIRTYCAMNVYLDGKLIVSKNQPDGTTIYNVPLNLPTGMSEIMLEIAPRDANCMIQTFMHDGRGDHPPQKPVAGDTIVLPTAKGRVLDPNSVAFACYMAVPKTPFVSPGKKTAILAIIQGSLPRAVGGLSARLVGPDGTPTEKDRPLAIGQLFQSEYTAPNDPRGGYEARMEFLANGKSLGIKTVPILCLEGFARESDTLEKEWRDRSTRSGHSMPNTQLAIEKIRLFVDGILGGGVDPDADVARELTDLVKRAHTFMPAEEQGKDPFEGLAGYIERGYTSVIDGGVQPYITAVPDAAVAKNADTFPLIIFLHGYDPNMNKNRWWEARDFAAVCARNGALMAIPFGRLNSDFQSCGEVDVMDVIKEMKAHYRVDPDRVYICGISMGGMGASTIAAHYPDEFAAALIIAGRADSPLQNYTALDNFHPFKQWLIQADNPISLCENLINVPVRIYHGQDDNVVPVTQATRMNTAYKNAGCKVQLYLMPGGHRAGFDLLKVDEPVKWMISNKRSTNPAAHHLKTYSLQYLRWAQVKITNDLTPIDVEWKGGGKDQIEVIKKSSNVLYFGYPNAIDQGSRKKSQDLCGPVREAIRGPFTIVYGTKGNAAANEFNKKNAVRFENEWFQFTRSHAQIKADSEVTPNEMRERNLFLFGEEQDNALHAQLAKDLPISIKNGTVTIGDKSMPLDGKGVMYIYPSAFSDRKHSVVICAGAPYGDKIGVNHKLDLIPDFLLYEGAAFDTDGTSTNTALCAGFFDQDWKIDPKTMWWIAKK